MDNKLVFPQPASDRIVSLNGTLLSPSKKQIYNRVSQFGPETVPLKFLHFYQSTQLSMFEISKHE